MFVFLLAMVGTTFAEPLFPFQVGQQYEFHKWDSDDPVNEWAVHAEVKSQVTIDSVNYFHVQQWNYDNDFALDDLYLRSTEDALYGYNPDGDDYLEFQKASVGTKWSFYQEDDSGFNYKVTEIVAIGPVTVPYGTFGTAYVHRKYQCVDPDDLGLGKSPDWYEWIVPGVGFVKEVDYWPKEGQIPPLIMELVDVISAPGTLSGWVRMAYESDIGYSLDENDLVYFLSFGPVWSYNFTTGLWCPDGPMGWVYVDWPFLHEFATDSLWFVLPPECGLWVYHFRTGEWTVLHRIIPW